MQIEFCGFKILTKRRKLDVAWHAIVRGQVYISNVPHVCQVQFVQTSLISMSDVTIFEHVVHVLLTLYSNLSEVFVKATTIFKKQFS